MDHQTIIRRKEHNKNKQLLLHTSTANYNIIVTLSMSVGEDIFYDALHDDLDLDVTGVGPTYDEDDKDDDANSKQQNDSEEGPPLPKTP